MEEGFMLVFPERVLAGDLPNRDFLHLYGPGSLWALAAWFKVFGVNLTAERIFGLLQILGVVLGIYALARYWGRTIALSCALLAFAFVLPPLALTALAWVGAVALGLLGLVATLEGRRRLETQPKSALRWALLGGIVFGLAVTFRLDLITAVLLAGGVALWSTNSKFAKRTIGGFALGVSPYLIHLLTTGPSTVFRGMVLDPVVNLRGGRRLPIPPTWDHLDGFLQRSQATIPPEWPIPSLGTPQQITVWFFALILTIIVLVAIGVWAVRRDRSRFEARVLLAVGLFSLGIAPQAFQRVDSAHFGWVSCVAIAFLPVALAELLRAKRPLWSLRRVNLTAATSVLLGVMLLIPYFTSWSYVDFAAQTFGKHRVALKIERNGRVFYYGRWDVKQAATELLHDVPKYATPGDRLFVGTSDLRKTPYSDAWLYYLLPEFPPGTHYIEMDPGVANSSRGQLASDLAGSDIAILSSVWDNWREPNGSRDIGSNRANEVLARDFCEIKNYGGLYTLYRRCDRAG